MSSTRSTGPTPAAVRKRGSVMLVSVIFGTCIALSLGSFVAIALNSARLSRRAFYANSALNLAEAGLEQALHSMNVETFGGDWSVHAGSGSNSRYKVTAGLDMGQGTSGEIQVLIYDITANVRHVVAEGRVVSSSGPAVTKQIEIYAGRRSLFANGLVAKEAITFNSNTASVDSWNSDPDNDPATAAVPYSDAVSRDYGSVASVSQESVNLGNADIWGYVGTGGDDPDVGPNGTISDFGTPKRSKTGTKDFTRVDKTFKQDFPPVVAPTGISPNIISSTISGAMTLPAVGDHTSIDPNDGVAKYFYQLPAVSLSGNGQILTISDNVVLLPTASSAISVSGKGTIAIAKNASLAIYTEGDISISGNGVINGSASATDANQPKNFQIWGTNTTPGGQSVSVSGNGVFSGIGYVPNGSFTVNGGGSSGDAQGAFVAKTVTLHGGVVFHYDESLKNFGSKNPFGLTSWRELLPEEYVSL